MLLDQEKKGKWYEKFIGKECTVFIQGKPEQYTFCGTCENPNTKNGLPLQYEFEQEGKPQVLLTYEEGRRALLGTRQGKRR